MPTIITHAVAAYATGKSIFKNPDKQLLITGMICAMLPDADVIGFRFGIPYESMWGHRGISHSFFFAALLSIVLTLIFRIYKSDKNPVYVFLFLFLATVSHGLLDTITNGGRGVALLAPFSEERYFAPWRPVRVSPFSVSHLISDYGFRVFASEIKFIWIPFLMMMIIIRKLKIIDYKL